MRNRETDDHDSKQLHREIQVGKDNLEKKYPVVCLDNGKVMKYGDIPREPVKKKKKWWIFSRKENGQTKNNFNHR